MLTTTTAAPIVGGCQATPVNVNVQWYAGLNVNFDRVICLGDSITWVWADGRTSHFDDCSDASRATHRVRWDAVGAADWRRLAQLGHVIWYVTFTDSS